MNVTRICNVQKMTIDTVIFKFRTITSGNIINKSPNGLIRYDEIW